MVHQDAAAGLIPDEIRREVEAHLQDLLSSAAFRGSRRSQEFLAYIVEEFLAGRGAAIKERNIAVDVFGKGANFDAQSESLVRVKAAEVRKRLAQAYTSGVTGRLRVELPIGSYQPILSFPREQVTQVLPASNVESKNRKASLPKAYRLAAYALLTFTGLFLSVILVGRLTRSNLDLLWNSFARGQKPVLISLPSPNVGAWNDHAKALSEATGLVASPGELNFGAGNYVGVGAAEGAARFGEQLTLRHRSFFLKFGSDVSFSDLRQSPSILLGAFTSRWTMELTRNLPFQFGNHGESGIVEIVEPKRSWTAERVASGEPRIGYALVTRLLNADSGNPLLMVAGIDAHDTQSAVEFLTREDYFAQFSKQAKNWDSANFQFVIRTSIHGHTPSIPNLITYKTW